MKKLFIFILLIFSICQQEKLFASCPPVDSKNLPKTEENIPYKEKKTNDSLLYVTKTQDNAQTQGQKPIVAEQNTKNIKVEPKEEILSQATRKINAIYPDDIAIATNTFPGYRGTNQLVIYKKEFGKTTGTNEFGKEAVVVGNVVTKLTGANSNIPKNGFVISGHGSAKKWISDNLKIGTRIEIQDKTIKAYTTIDSYRFYAKTKIEEVENLLISSNEYNTKDDKYIYYYLKKAKHQYKKSLKQDNEEALECAKEAANNAILAFRYTLPFIQNELKGTWIRPVQKNQQEVAKTLDLIKETGINNIFLETYYHGRTIFPSRVMQEYGFENQNPAFNFDVLASYIQEAHKRGIKVNVWFESFYVGNNSPELNPKSILAKKPSWQNRTKQKADFQGYVSHPQEHNGYFLDPANPEVITFLTRLIGEICARYNIDGVNIDYVRYPNVSKENYGNQWGYTPIAREEFKTSYDIDPIEIEPKSPMWDNWCDYRREKITDYVKKVSELLKNRNIMFSAVIFPDYKVSLQTKHQDWKYWLNQKYLDAITPLILTSDDELAKDMLDEIRKKASDNAKVYPGLFAGFIESDPEDLLKQIHIIRRLKLNGVILFDWAHLNQKYIDVLKTSVFKNANIN